MLKMAPRSFLGSVPFKFEHKVPRNTTAGKIGYDVISLP